MRCTAASFCIWEGSKTARDEIKVLELLDVKEGRAEYMGAFLCTSEVYSLI